MPINNRKSDFNNIQNALAAGRNGSYSAMQELRVARHQINNMISSSRTNIGQVTGGSRDEWRSLLNQINSHNF